MGWAFYKNHEGRDCGYGVPATCDYPGCDAKIDRGLSYLCGTLDAVEGGGPGCGKYFCSRHLPYVREADDGRLAALCRDCAWNPIDAQYFTKEDAEEGGDPPNPPLVATPAAASPSPRPGPTIPERP